MGSTGKPTPLRKAASPPREPDRENQRTFLVLFLLLKILAENKMGKMFMLNKINKNFLRLKTPTNASRARLKSFILSPEPKFTTLAKM